MKFLSERISRRKLLLDQIELDLEEEINQLFKAVYRSLICNGKIILIGNGGSFAIAQHISSEFTGRFVNTRKSLPSIVLGSNPSSFSAISNDFGYETSFSRELTSLGDEKDILIAMSVSGTSKNIIQAIEASTEMGIKSFFLTGGSKINSNLNTNYIKIPSKDTAMVQEIHFFLLHELCKFIDDKFTKN